MDKSDSPIIVFFTIMFELNEVSPCTCKRPFNEVSERPMNLVLLIILLPIMLPVVFALPLMYKSDNPEIVFETTRFESNDTLPLKNDGPRLLNVPDTSNVYEGLVVSIPNATFPL